MTYEEIQKLYTKYFSINFLGTNISNKFAIISLTCYLVYKLKAKKPDITSFTVLSTINKNLNKVPENFLRRLAIICDDFAYGCTEFPTFDLKDKEIPGKIEELLNEWIPF